MRADSEMANLSRTTGEAYLGLFWKDSKRELLGRGDEDLRSPLGSKGIDFATANSGSTQLNNSFSRHRHSSQLSA